MCCLLSCTARSSRTNITPALTTPSYKSSPQTSAVVRIGMHFNIKNLHVASSNSANERAAVAQPDKMSVLPAVPQGLLAKTASAAGVPRFNIGVHLVMRSRAYPVKRPFPHAPAGRM